MIYQKDDFPRCVKYNLNVSVLGSVKKMKSDCRFVCATETVIPGHATKSIKPHRAESKYPSILMAVRNPFNISKIHVLAEFRQTLDDLTFFPRM